LSGLPDRGTDVPTRLEVRPDAVGLTWIRHFGAQPLVTRQRALGRGAVAERLGVIECSFEPRVTADGIEYRQRDARLCLGPLRVPLPSLARPRIEARAWARDQVMEVDVVLHLPFVGWLLRYRGFVRPEETA
jgi:hypothetical protein